jgi:hypothetical protein
MSDLVLHEINQSNIPAAKKSAIRSWYDRMTGSITGFAHNTVAGHVREGTHAIRQGGEALITGAALGLIDAEHGLDMGKIPIDGVIAAAGLIGSVVMAHDPYGISADVRNIGSDALAILTFRKTKAWREKAKGKSTAHGEDDPIAIAAADL